MAGEPPENKRKRMVMNKMQRAEPQGHEKRKRRHMATRQAAAEKQVAGRVLEPLPGYLSVAEAADRLGVSGRSIYDYIEKGQLPAWKVGTSVAVAEEAVRQFRRQPAGRMRYSVPPWHAPATGNAMEVTTIRFRVRPEQHARLDALVQEMHQKNQHAIRGTVIRSIARDTHDASAIEIMLIWRSRGAPPAEVYEAAVAALLAAFAEVMESDSVQRTQACVLIHA